MLTIATWRWGSRYAGYYVERLKAGIERHLKEEYRFAVFGPQAEDVYLTQKKGCFCRLRMFDPAWQETNGIKEGDRIVCIDLDVVVTAQLDDLFDRPEDFVILQGANSSNPGRFNGSLQMLRAGKHGEVWSEFSLDAARKVPWFEFPDDQSWIEARIPDAAGWQAGSASGVYAFQKPGWPPSTALPKDARLVVFPGWRDPSKFTHLDWVKEHWAA